jgi:hypothetical protein
VKKKLLLVFVCLIIIGGYAAGILFSYSYYQNIAKDINSETPKATVTNTPKLESKKLSPPAQVSANQLATVNNNTGDINTAVSLVASGKVVEGATSKNKAIDSHFTQTALNRSSELTPENKLLLKKYIEKRIPRIKLSVIIQIDKNGKRTSTKKVSNDGNKFSIINVALAETALSKVSVLNKVITTNECVVFFTDDASNPNATTEAKAADSALQCSNSYNGYVSWGMAKPRIDTFETMDPSLTDQIKSADMIKSLVRGGNGNRIPVFMSSGREAGTKASGEYFSLSPITYSLNNWGYLPLNSYVFIYPDNAWEMDGEPGRGNPVTKKTVAHEVGHSFQESAYGRDLKGRSFYPTGAESLANWMACETTPYAFGAGAFYDMNERISGLDRDTELFLGDTSFLKQFYTGVNPRSYSLFDFYQYVNQYFGRNMVLNKDFYLAENPITMLRNNNLSRFKDFWTKYSVSHYIDDYRSNSYNPEVSIMHPESTNEYSLRGINLGNNLMLNKSVAVTVEGFSQKAIIINGANVILNSNAYQVSLKGGGPSSENVTASLIVKDKGKTPQLKKTITLSNGSYLDLDEVSGGVESYAIVIANSNGTGNVVPVEVKVSQVINIGTYSYRDSNSNRKWDASEKTLTGFCYNLSADNVPAGRYCSSDLGWAHIRLVKGHLYVLTPESKAGWQSESGPLYFDTRTAESISALKRTWSFGYHLYGKITIRTFNDKNFNGKKNTNEGYVKGFKYEIYRDEWDSEARVVKPVYWKTTPTISTTYTIVPVNGSGGFTIKQLAPVKYAATTTESLRVNINEKSPEITYASFGVRPKPVITIATYNDKNFNLKRNSGETNLAGVQYSICSRPKTPAGQNFGECFGATTTKSKLKYSFNADPRRDYEITEGQLPADFMAGGYVSSTSPGVVKTVKKMSVKSPATTLVDFPARNLPHLRLQTFFDNNKNGKIDNKEALAGGFYYNVYTYGKDDHVNAYTWVPFKTNVSSNNGAKTYTFSVPPGRYMIEFVKQPSYWINTNYSTPRIINVTAKSPALFYSNFGVVPKITTN